MQSALYYGNTNQSEYYVKSNDVGDITSQNLPVLNGKTILRYACSNELIFSSGARTSIGTICHEFGHVLGLADLYITKTGATGNPKSVPGSWALMSNGNYLNNGNTPPNLSVWEKYYLGWVEPEMLRANEHVVLPADGMTYRKLNRTCIHSEDGPLTTDTTYYLENRQMTGWDTFLPDLRRFLRRNQHRPHQ
jgi:M6 family metalloprotease-like protein